VSKNDYLSHALTPGDLGAINQSIFTLLGTDNVVNDQVLRRLVIQRDELIQSHLKSLNKVERDQFAKAELPINNKLHAAVQSLFTDSLSELSGLVRGLKAIKKYK
jgi:hypothetical protein